MISTSSATLTESCWPRPPRRAKGSSIPSITLIRPDTTTCIASAKARAMPRLVSSLEAPRPR